jgi:circadian clock protein KaiB
VDHPGLLGGPWQRPAADMTRHKLEVVDVLENPRRAMAEGVLVTPSLTKLSPHPVAQVVGNLSDKRRVLLALGLKPGVE